MTLVLIAKGTVLEGWPSKIEVSWALGTYKYIYIYIHLAAGHHPPQPCHRARGQLHDIQASMIGLPWGLCNTRKWHDPEGHQRLPSLKLTAGRRFISSWSFGLFSGAFAISFRECTPWRQTKNAKNVSCKKRLAALFQSKKNYLPVEFQGVKPIGIAPSPPMKSYPYSSWVLNMLL